MTEPVATRLTVQRPPSQPNSSKSGIVGLRLLLEPVPVDPHSPPLSRLLGTIVIGGCSLHVEAIEVKQVDGFQTPVDERCEDTLDELYALEGGNGQFTTAEIDGRQYVVYCTPYLD